MKIRQTLLAVTTALLLASCGDGDGGQARGAGDGLISSLADTVVDEVRQEMETENLPLQTVGDLPKAELTPDGVLLIDGVAVAMDPAQRKVALAYREAVIRVAQDGARVGLMGAQVAKDAAAAAVAGVFSGADEADVEAKIRASTQGIEAEAKKLCATLPALLAQQQALADAVPAFAPYADMSQDDVDDCMHEVQLQ